MIQTQSPQVPVLDTARLHRQTMGDSAMQVEVLSLFVAEAERIMRQIEDAPTTEVRSDRLHAMVGVARNVGAGRVVQAAQQVEKQVAAETIDLEPLRVAVAETLAYVRNVSL